MKTRVRSGRSASPKYWLMRGVSLIESLVALVIMLIGLLGLASLTISSMRFTDDSGMRSSAVNIAYDIADRIRANITVRDRYVTDFGDVPASAADCVASSCSESELAGWDLAQWKQALATALPSGEGKIADDAAANRIAVTVRWTDRGIVRQYQLVMTYRA